MFVVDRELKSEIEIKLKKQYDNDRFIFIRTFSKGKHLNIGKVPLQHDAYCLGWIIEDVSSKESLCFIADNGMYPYKLLDNDLFNRTYTYYMIESNYDEYMQYTDTTRNELLKRRVLSTKGHSSNFNAIEKAVKLLSVNESHNCKGVMFTHLSEHCNTEELASASHMAYLTVWGKKTLFKNVKISYAKQDEAVEI